MALVQDHGVEPREPARVEHVAEDLRGHDEHGSARIDLDVAREDPDLLRAELAAEVRVLLVGERLERRGVGDAPAAVERRVDGELRDERLARPGGRRDDDGLARADGGDGAELEVVQEERVAGLEGLDQIVGHAQWPLFSHLSMMLHYTRHRV